MTCDHTDAFSGDFGPGHRALLDAADSERISTQCVLTVSGANAECLQRAAQRVGDILAASDHRLAITQKQSDARAIVSRPNLRARLSGR